MRVLKRILGIFGLILAVSYAGLITYAYWPTGIEEVPARSLAGPNDKFVAVEDLELRYQAFGTPGEDRPNVVLLHGFGNSLQSFRLLAPLLAEDYYVITVDLPGFGLSSKPVDYDYRGANQARMIGKFIRALGFEKTIIGGHSLGGALALRVAVNEPEINGLILMNPGIIETGVPPITQYLPFPFQRLSARQFGDPAFRKRFLQIAFVNPDIVTDEVIDSLQLAVRSEGYLAGTTSMMGQYEAATEQAMLPQVEVPTIIVWGEQDRNKTPAELALLRAGLRNNIVITSADAGHYVHEESPELVARGLVDAKYLWR